MPEDERTPRPVPVKIVEMPTSNTDAVEREIETMKIVRTIRAESVEEERKVRAEGLEGERLSRAEGLEDVRQGRAEGIEDDRLKRAVALEIEKLGLAGGLEDDRIRRATRVSKQMIVLACFFVVVSIVLSIRSEINSAALQRTQENIVQAQYEAKVAIYQTCLQTAERTTKINPGRVALVELFVQLVNDSTLDETKKTDARQQLSDGLVVPPLNCGEAPVK